MAESGVKIVPNNITLQEENKLEGYNQAVDEAKTDIVMEAMLLEDYRWNNVPRSVKNLFNYFKEEGVELDRSDIVVVFVYILMLEAGFVPLHFKSLGIAGCDFHYKRLLSLTTAMPMSWKSDKTRSLKFILESYPNYVCNVSFVPVFDELIVNWLLKCNKNKQENFSVLVDPALHVLNPCFNNTHDSLGLFQNLRGLSRNCKNVAHYCKRAILNIHHIRSVSLFDLPVEMFDKIFKYCGKFSLTYYILLEEYFKYRDS